MSRNTRSNGNLLADYQIPATPSSGARPRSAPSARSASSARTVRIQPRVVSRSTVTPQITMANPSPAEVWTANPNLGDFNPGTAAGAKIFEKKTKGLPLEKRLPLTRQSAEEFRTLVEANAGTFGNAVTKIPVEFAADGTTPTKFVNLMEDYSDISLELLQRESMKIFGTAVDAADPLSTGPFPLRDINPGTDDQDKKTFYKRVHRHTLCKFLKNTFND